MADYAAVREAVKAAQEKTTLLREVMRLRREAERGKQEVSTEAENGQGEVSTVEKW